MMMMMMLDDRHLIQFECYLSNVEDICSWKILFKLSLTSKAMKLL